MGILKDWWFSIRLKKEIKEKKAQEEAAFQDKVHSVLANVAKKVVPEIDEDFRYGKLRPYIFNALMKNVLSDKRMPANEKAKKITAIDLCKCSGSLYSGMYRCSLTDWQIEEVLGKAFNAVKYWEYKIGDMEKIESFVSKTADFANDLIYNYEGNIYDERAIQIYVDDKLTPAYLKFDKINLIFFFLMLFL